MRIRKRHVGFCVIAVLVVIVLADLPVDRMEVVRTESAAKTKTPTPSAQRQNRLVKPPEKTTTLVTLYDKGDIRVPEKKQIRKTPKKKPSAKKKQAPPPRPAPKQTLAPAPAPPPPPPTASPEKVELPKPAPEKKEGKWPVLEVGYDDIGFERYLAINEQLGHTFVLVETEEGRRLGREFSLINLQFSLQARDRTSLAMERPHLISDEKINALLPNRDGATEILPGHVVLILKKEIDELLWGTIRDALNQRDLDIYQVSRISGEYTMIDNVICLKLTQVSLQGSGETVSLGDGIRMPI